MTEDTLTVRQHKALSALMTEPSLSKAAEACAVPERTLRTWLRRPAFDAAYREARREATRQAMAQGQQYSAACMRRLVWLAGNAKSEAVQASSARTVLEFSFKAVEIEDLRDEIAQLRALIHDRMGDEPAEL